MEAVGFLQAACAESDGFTQVRNRKQKYRRQNGTTTAAGGYEWVWGEDALQD